MYERKIVVYYIHSEKLCCKF